MRTIEEINKDIQAVFNSSGIRPAGPGDEAFREAVEEHANSGRFDLHERLVNLAFEWDEVQRTTTQRPGDVDISAGVVHGEADR